MKEPRRIRFSIVVPVFNEEGSTATLYVTLTQVMRSLGEPYEIVFIDDGSTDRSPQFLGIFRKQIRAFAWSLCGETLAKLRR